jgi:hypothetical protein
MVALFPAAIENGKAGDDATANTEPVTFNCDTETLVLEEVLFTVMEPLPELPTATVPKLTEVGETVICPAGWVPVPLSATLTFGFEAFETTAKLPDDAPLAVGV